MTYSLENFFGTTLVVWYDRKKNFFTKKTKMTKKIDFENLISKKKFGFVNFEFFFVIFGFLSKKNCQKIRIVPKNYRAKFFVIMSKIES